MISITNRSQMAKSTSATVTKDELVLTISLQSENNIPWKFSFVQSDWR